MSDPRKPDPMSRRGFLHRGAIGVSAAATGALASHARGAAPHREDNPFEYKLGDLGKVDPALFRYERKARFKVPQKEPRRVALGPDGNLYVAAGREIVVMSRGGALIRRLGCSGPARCVALDRDGTLFVGLKERIELLDSKGRQMALWAPPAGRPFFTGLALTADHVFVADAGNRVILRYDRSGTLKHRIGERNPDRNVAGLVVPSPFLDVEAGPDGLLWVNNPGRHRVELYTVDGDLERFWGRGSVAIDGFVGCCNPVNLALLPDSRCLTFEKGLPRVKIYDAQGKLISVVAAPDSFADPSKELASAPDSANESMNGLDGVVDSAGTVYVLDLLGEDIHVMVPKTGDRADSETATQPNA